MLRKTLSALGNGGSGKGGSLGRTYEDMLAILDHMTAQKPNRSSDNIEVTRRLISSLKLQPALRKMQFVHIAGTKGKGTTAAYTASLLQSYGFKVGLFTSPHLTDIRERILVDNALIPKAQFAKYFFELASRYEELKYSESLLDRENASRSNYFRFLFLLSLYLFAEESVEVAVMEVGIGGRLDATNVIVPAATVITSLELEHMDILGDTVEKIAAEKAGIMKEGVVCYASPQKNHPETRHVLQAVSRTVGAPLVFLDDGVLPIRNWPKLAIGGAHAIEDSKLAILASRKIAGIPPVAPLDEVERTVLQTMTYPGRSHIIPMGENITLYLDGAHTVDSLESATQWFLSASEPKSGEPEPRRVLVFYTSRDPRRLLKAFMPSVRHFSKVVLPLAPSSILSHGGTTPTATSAEKELLTLTAEAWRQLYREVPCFPCGSRFEEVEDFESMVVSPASDRDDASKPVHVFVTGSFYLLSNILKLLITREDAPPMTG